MTEIELELAFPGLVGTEYRITSPRSVDYNCVAWAAGRSDRWWWPDALGKAHWPDGPSRTPTLEAFVEAFAQLGYSRCHGGAFEVGKEKIAIFAKGAEPTHAARQLPGGKWTSKLGKSVDVEHNLDALVGERYGQVVCILNRPRAVE